MDWYSMSDLGVLGELGSRLKRRRLERDWSQAHLAERAGINRTTVSEIERGKPASLLTFVQIMRALGALSDLDAMLPDLGPSPLQLAKTQGRQRRRASRRPRLAGGRSRLDGGGET